jgi:hypothetical protein
VTPMASVSAHSAKARGGPRRASPMLASRRPARRSFLSIARVPPAPAYDCRESASATGSSFGPGASGIRQARRQRRSATSAQTASTRPKGQAPARNP